MFYQLLTTPQLLRQLINHSLQMNVKDSLYGNFATTNHRLFVQVTKKTCEEWTGLFIGSLINNNTQFITILYGTRQEFLYDI